MAVPGSDVATFAVGDASVSVATDAGPRIVAYGNNSSRGPFAQLLGETIDHPGLEPFYMIGGHRLWRAPEVPLTSYEPDSGAVTVAEASDGLELLGSPDSDGIVKVITVSSAGSMTVVDHELRNEGSKPLITAAWAITQVEPGGVCVIPHSNEQVDTDGVLPNRTLSVWPYTDLSGTEIEFGHAETKIHATGKPTTTKIGSQNQRGWMAYAFDDGVFVKWSPIHRPMLEYPDRGCSVECYRNNLFMELETLGPMVTLEPGESVQHRELWQLFTGAKVNIGDLLADLPIDPEAMNS